jgi:hypothetical protein
MIALRNTNTSLGHGLCLGPGQRNRLGLLSIGSLWLERASKSRAGAESMLKLRPVLGWKVRASAPEGCIPRAILGDRSGIFWPGTYCPGTWHTSMLWSCQEPLIPSWPHDLSLWGWRWAESDLSVTEPATAGMTSTDESEMPFWGLPSMVGVLGCRGQEVVMMPRAA